VDSIEVSTLVYLPPEDVYDFLIDFPGYVSYSKYLERVREHGDGGPGTEYDLRFAWWKLSYTVRSRVVDVDPPRRIDWRVVEDIDARGRWTVEHVPEEAGDRADACRVRLHVDYRPDSVDRGALDLPTLVSLDWLVDRVKPLVEEEAERVVRRIVADLEGSERPVDLEVHTTPSSV